MIYTVTYGGHMDSLCLFYGCEGIKLFQCISLGTSLQLLHEI